MTYPGLYQAKATKVSRLGVEALIPQVFGEAPVTIQRFMGAQPSSVGIGWVIFIAGNPEYPVWCSGTVIQSGGDTPIVFPDEVWVGTDAPTDPVTDLWVDTDASDPTPTPPVPWIGATLLNGWFVQTGDMPMQYRKIGDIVYYRGYVRNANVTVAGSIILFPVNYRPPYFDSLNVGYGYGGSSYGTTTLGIYADGRLWYDGFKGSVQFIGINGSFSVTA